MSKPAPAFAHLAPRERAARTRELREIAASAAGQVTLADLATMTPPEIMKAKQAGRLDIILGLQEIELEPPADESTCAKCAPDDDDAA